MAVPQNWYSWSAEHILATLWLNNPLKIALMQAGFVPDRDNQHVWPDIAASELPTGGGYTAGGILLGTKAANYDSASDTTHFDAADANWGPTATFNAAFAVVYDSSGAQPLWSLIDFQGVKTVVNGTFAVSFDTLGVLDVIAA